MYLRINTNQAKPASKEGFHFKLMKQHTLDDWFGVWVGWQCPVKTEKERFLAITKAVLVCGRLFLKSDLCAAIQSLHIARVDFKALQEKKEPTNFRSNCGRSEKISTRGTLQRQHLQTAWRYGIHGHLLLQRINTAFLRAQDSLQQMIVFFSGNLPKCPNKFQINWSARCHKPLSYLQVNCCSMLPFLMFCWCHKCGVELSVRQKRQQWNAQLKQAMRKKFKTHSTQPIESIGTTDKGHW